MRVHVMMMMMMINAMNVMTATLIYTVSIFNNLWETENKRRVSQENKGLERLIACSLMSKGKRKLLSISLRLLVYTCNLPIRSKPECYFDSSSFYTFLYILSHVI